MKKVSILILVGLGLIIGPLLITILAGLTASVLNCGNMNEGQIIKCEILGLDIGPGLSSMGLMAWLTIFTAPFGFIVIGAGVAIKVIVKIIKKSN